MKNILLGTIAGNQQTLNQVGTVDNSKRLVTFVRRDNVIEVRRNLDYENELRVKIEDLIKFLVPLEAFRSTVKYIDFSYQELIKLFALSQSHQNYWFENIDNLIIQQNQAIENHTQDLENLRARDVEFIKRLEFSGRNQRSIIATVDKQVADLELQQEKAYQVEKASKIATAENYIVQGTKNLQELKLQRAEVNDTFPKKLSEIRDDYNKLVSDFAQLNNFLDTIHQARNLLINIVKVPTFDSQLHDLIASVPQFRGNEKKLFLKLLLFYQDVSIKGELISNNNEIAITKVRIAEEIAKRPFLQAELSKTQELLAIAEDKLEKLKIFDTVRHLQDNVRVLDRNTDEIQRKVASISLSKTRENVKVLADIDVDLRRNGNDLGLQRNKEFVKLDYLNDVNLYVPNIYTDRVDPYNVNYGPKVRQAQEEVDQLKFHCNNLEIALSVKEKLEQVLSNLEKKPELIVQGHQKEYANKKADYDNKSLKYLQLLSNFVVQDYLIDSTNTPSLIGAMLSHSYVLQEPSCCACCYNQKPFINTSITLGKFYNSFAKVIRDLHHIENKLCVSNEKRIYSTDNITMRDVIFIITDTQFIGALRNFQGNQQISQNGIRTEDINDALFYITQSVANLIILQKKLYIKLEENVTKALMKNYADRIDIIQHSQNAMIHPVSENQYQAIRSNNEDNIQGINNNKQGLREKDIEYNLLDIIKTNITDDFHITSKVVGQEELLINLHTWQNTSNSSKYSALVKIDHSLLNVKHALLLMVERNNNDICITITDPLAKEDSIFAIELDNLCDLLKTHLGFQNIVIHYAGIQNKDYATCADICLIELQQLVSTTINESNMQIGIQDFALAELIGDVNEI